MKYFRKYVLSILLCFILTGCGQQAGFSESVSAVPESNFTESQTGVPETVMQQQTDANAEKAEIKSASDNVRPSKEEVLAMREKTLDGMPETEISRLRENIKVANLQMESAYLNDNLFKKLSDKESPYWKYFDCKGDIQLVVSSGDLSEGCHHESGKYHRRGICGNLYGAWNCDE